ncbi:2-octaprenyl-6-methoxyphenyl hydroxylase [Pseudoalteromonas phenolica]|uniref:2-octaprenyl-6-methoxyphenyl hydroxylase n=1 Tax=Pseudoalteromonas phenolica TaxID=161398 RepID=A0A4Q7IJT3_9GAMM|nr:2-octaprenyl-6-methoxyphenyl hydroxylase [Pseudoalteromonas phenolica]RZQ51832.1 2-octaprenyl-6-methoxyphenyl hydroxylase [Pseudoalteromonas phenolica]
MQHFDVVIVGGGMAGATAALAIKKTSPTLQVAVIEAFAPKSQTHPSFDDRSIALADQSVQYLKQFNLFNADWPFAEAIKQVHVSDRGHFGKTSLHYQDYKTNALGYVVEVNPFGAYLHQQLAKTDIQLYCPATIKELKQTQDSVELMLNDETQLNGKLLVVADGAQSPTRKQLNIGFDSLAYEQGALIANIEVEGGHSGQAFERFTEHGPMALLPMTQNRYSLVWCMPNAHLEHYKTLEPDAFIAELQAAFGYRAGVFKQVGMRAQYPLVLGRVEQLVHHRSVLIGNAAHAIHPIAGQGFNLGLRDIQALVELIVSEQHALGEHAFTQAYNRARAQDIKTVMTLTDALVRLFSNSSRLMAFGRSCGLLAMSLSENLKAPLAKQLMGHVIKGKS